MTGYTSRLDLIRILGADAEADVDRGVSHASGEILSAAGGTWLLQNRSPMAANRSAHSCRDSAPLMKPTTLSALAHMVLTEAAPLSGARLRHCPLRQDDITRSKSTCFRGLETTSSRAAG